MTSTFRILQTICKCSKTLASSSRQGRRLHSSAHLAAANRQLFNSLRGFTIRRADQYCWMAGRLTVMILTVCVNPLATWDRSQCFSTPPFGKTYCWPSQMQLRSSARRRLRLQMRGTSLTRRWRKVWTRMLAECQAACLEAKNKELR